jgi:hypothetical protein
METKVDAAAVHATQCMCLQVLCMATGLLRQQEGVAGLKAAVRHATQPGVCINCSVLMLCAACSDVEPAVLLAPSKLP